MGEKRRICAGEPRILSILNSRGWSTAPHSLSVGCAEGSFQRGQCGQGKCTFTEARPDKHDLGRVTEVSVTRQVVSLRARASLWDDVMQRAFHPRRLPPQNPSPQSHHEGNHQTNPNWGTFFQRNTWPVLLKTAKVVTGKESPRNRHSLEGHKEASRGSTMGWAPEPETGEN